MPTTTAKIVRITVVPTSTFRKLRTRTCWASEVRWADSSVSATSRRCAALSIVPLSASFLSVATLGSFGSTVATSSTMLGSVAVTSARDAPRTMATSAAWVETQARSTSTPVQPATSEPDRSAAPRARARHSSASPL